MGFVAALGAAVVGAFGATAVSATVATVVGGAIVGAATGALYSAFTGGDVGKGLLWGAVGGAALGGLGAELSLVNTSGVSNIASSGVSGATSFGASEAAAAGMQQAAGGGLLAGTKSTMGTVASSFFGSAANGGGVYNLGAAFLQGGLGDDKTEELARQFDETRKQTLEDRASLSASATSAANYAAQNAPTVTNSEIALQRLELPSPVWSNGYTAASPAVASPVTTQQREETQQSGGLLQQWKNQVSVPKPGVAA